MITTQVFNDYLPTVEVAEVLGMSRENVAVLARKGKFESIGGGKPGRDVFISKRCLREQLLTPVRRYEELTGEELLK